VLERRGRVARVTGERERLDLLLLECVSTSSLANARTLLRLERSSDITSTLAATERLVIDSSASLAREGLRHASTTCAPFSASTAAASRPMPLLAPVTTNVFPR
jgi:hypothetical protein